MRIQQHIFNEEKQRHHDKQKRAKAKRHRPKGKTRLQLLDSLEPGHVSFKGSDSGFKV